MNVNYVNKAWGGLVDGRGALEMDQVLAGWSIFNQLLVVMEHSSNLTLIADRQTWPRPGWGRLVSVGHDFNCLYWPSYYYIYFTLSFLTFDYVSAMRAVHAQSPPIRYRIAQKK